MAHWLTEAVTWIAVLAALGYFARRLWPKAGGPRTGCASCDGCAGCPARRADSSGNR